MDFKSLLFNIICIFHILIWIIIIFGFLNKKLAKLNVYIFVPLIYILHILPFHILVTLKQKMYQKTYQKRVKAIEKGLIIPHFVLEINEKLEKFCTFSPLTPQGLLILGMLTSIYSLYPINLFKINST
jgi:hypothetical protein